jgi:hypothetical protein
MLKKDSEHAHDDRVRGPAPEARGRPEQAADHQADRGHAEPDLERDPAAVQDAGEDVIAHRVGTEDVAGRQRRQPRFEDAPAGRLRHRVDQGP